MKKMEVYHEHDAKQMRSAARKPGPADKKRSEVLEDAVRKIRNNRTPWYESLGLRFDRTDRRGDHMAVETVLAVNVVDELLFAGNETVLAPVLTTVKNLLETVRGTSNIRDDVMELVEYCVCITRCVVETARLGIIPRTMLEMLGSLTTETEAVRRFAQTCGTHTACCWNLVRDKRNRNIIAKHRRRLEQFLDLTVVTLGMAKDIESRRAVVKLAKIPPAAPLLPKTYVRRSVDESVVLDLLNPTRPASAVHCLWGSSGGGKSLLAASVVRDERVLTSFSQGLFWVSMGAVDKEQIALLVEQLALQFALAPAGRGYRLLDEFDAPEEMAHNLRRAGAKYRCLVVLDGVRDIEVVNTFATTGFHLLITTRKPSVVPPINSGVYTEVGSMTVREALKVLKGVSRVAEALPELEATKVAVECRMLPLPLGMAGNLAKKNNPLEPACWRSVNTRLKVRRRSFRTMAQVERERALFGVVEAICETLPSVQRKQLKLMAVMAPGVHATRKMLANLWDVDVNEISRIIRVLVDHGFLQEISQGYIMHDLVLQYLRFEIKSDKDSLALATFRQARFMATSEVLCASLTGEKDICGGRLPLIASWSSLRKLDAKLNVKDFYLESLAGMTDKRFWHQAGSVLRFLGEHAAAAQMYKKVLAITEQEGVESKELASALYSVALVMDEQGKYEQADPLYTRAIEIIQKVEMPNNLLLARYLNTRAGLLRNQGKYEEADPLILRAIEVGKGSVSFNHPAVADMLHNRGCLLEQQGDYHQAEVMYVCAVEVGEKAMGAYHPTLAAWLNDWAGLLQKQGKYKEADTVYSRSLDIGEKMLGPDHITLARWLSKWAGLLDEQGKSKAADVLYVRAINIGDKTLHPDHPDLVDWLNSRTILLEEQGNYHDADPLYLRLIEVAEKTGGPEHKNLAVLLNNRAGLLEKQGEYEEADLHYTRAIEIGERILGPQNLDLAGWLNNRAVLLEKQGFQGEADELYIRAFEIGEKAIGTDHPDLAAILNNMAALLQKEEKYGEAQVLYERSIAIWKSVLGGEDVRVVAGLNNMARMLAKQGKYDEALPPAQRALEIVRKNLPKGHEDTIAMQSWVDAVRDMVDQAA